MDIILKIISFIIYVSWNDFSDIYASATCISCAEVAEFSSEDIIAHIIYYTQDCEISDVIRLSDVPLV